MGLGLHIALSGELGAVLVCSCRHVEAYYDFKAVEVYWTWCERIVVLWLFTSHALGLACLVETERQWGGIARMIYCRNLLLQWEVHKVHHGQLERDCLRALHNFSGLWKASVLNLGL